MTRRKRRQLHELPVRVCRYGERCLVCLERIDAGEQYYDGAHGRRAHMACAALVGEGKRREPTRAELPEWMPPLCDECLSRERVEMQRLAHGGGR